MGIPRELKLTLQQRRFFELRFNRGLKQREIASTLGIGRPAVSRREGRIRDRFVAAGFPEPIAPGRKLFAIFSSSL